MELEDITKMLVINKHRLDDELEVQADIQWQIAEQLTITESRRDEAKNELDRLEAELMSEIAEDDPKLSLAKIQAKVLVNPTRVKAFQNLQMLKRDHNRWSGMLNSWISKGKSLSNLCELYKSNYFAMDSDRSVISKSDNYPSTKEYREGREALTKARRQRLSESTTDETPRITRRRTILD